MYVFAKAASIQPINDPDTSAMCFGFAILICDRFCPRSNTAVALEKACVLRDMATFKWTENEPAEAKQLLNQSLSLLNRFLGRTHRVYLETAELLTRINADPMI